MEVVGTEKESHRYACELLEILISEYIGDRRGPGYRNIDGSIFMAKEAGFYQRRRYCYINGEKVTGLVWTSAVAKLFEAGKIDGLK